jgi:hypothetical protein
LLVGFGQYQAKIGTTGLVADLGVGEGAESTSEAI